jgi:hypothetical protein
MHFSPFMRCFLGDAACIASAKWPGGEAKPILPEGKRSFFRRRRRQVTKMFRGMIQKTVATAVAIRM